MEHYIASRSLKPVDKNDIIAISNMAKADKAAGNDVINGSIGVFLDDNKEVGKVLSIDKALSEHVTDKLGYSSVYGDMDYNNAVEKWVFDDKYDEIKNMYSVFTGSTLGGTGGVSIAFNLFLEEGQNVLLPDVMWTNYILIAKKAGLGYETYSMFTSDGKFNLESLKEHIQFTMKEFGRCLVVINDPCQNPTGYCLSEEEYDELFKMLNILGKDGKLTVLFDIAYLSYYAVPDSKCKLIDKIAEKKSDFISVVIFSCSKVFGLYGLRMGAFIALALDDDEKVEIKNAFGAQARGVYSCSVSAPGYAISKIMTDPIKKQQLVDEINHNKDVLNERGTALIAELDKAGIKYYPYKSGFFVTIKVENAFGIFEKLKAEHIYIVPLSENTIRIALSGMTKEEVVVLVRELKKAM